MAISKTIIKLNHIEALIKVVNDAAAPASITIALATDLLKSNEDLDVALAPVVNISETEVAVAVTGEINLTRNGVVIHNYFENSEGYHMNWGGDNQNNTSDIVVNMTNKGTIYMRLLKLHGFKPKFMPEQGVNL